MAKTHTVALTDVEINHLLTALIDLQMEGTYYGPRQQFYDRTARIFKKLSQAQGDGKN